MKVRLGDVCSFFSGTGFPNIYQGQKTGKYPIYKVGDISKNVLLGNRELIFSDNYIDDDTVKAIKGTVLPPKTVVFAKIGEALKLNRRAITGCYCLIDNNAMGILADNSVLDELYFYYFMCSVDLQHYCESTAVPSVRKARISEIEIPLPPLDEQRRIAAVLDKVSDLIAKRRAQLDKLDELVKARFVEMFGNFAFERDMWEICDVGTVAEIIDPQPSHRTPPISEDGIPYVGIAECNYETLCIDFKNARKVGKDVLKEHLARYKVNDGDFIIGKIGTIGKPFFVPAKQNYTLSANTVLMKPAKSKVYPQFLFSIFQSEYMDRIIDEEKKSTSQPAFGIQKIRKIEIPLPPLEIQKRFALFVEQSNKSKLTIQKSLVKLEILKKALLQEYFG